MSTLAESLVKRGSRFKSIKSKGLGLIMTPKYLNRRTICKGMMLFGKELGSGSTGIKVDLSQLMSKPDHLPNSPMIAITGEIDADTSLKYNNMSSAYREIRSSRCPVRNPATSGEERMRHARGSMAIANKSGDRGQPCLVPLCNAKESDSRPFARILAVGALYSRRTHDLKTGPNPILSSTAQRNDYSTLSKALAASKETTALAPTPLSLN